MKTFNIAVVAGDGIGKEVVPEGLRVLEAAGQRFGFRLQCHAFDWSCETYVRTGKLMPDDGLQQLRPDWFDDVVGSNLFGDILSDLGPAVVGSIGIAPSADLNPEKEFPSCLSPFMLCTGYRGETNCESHWADLVRGNDAAALGPTRGSRRIEDAITMVLAERDVRNSRYWRHGLDQGLRLSNCVMGESGDGLLEQHEIVWHNRGSSLRVLSFH